MHRCPKPPMKTASPEQTHATVAISERERERHARVRCRHTAASSGIAKGKSSRTPSDRHRTDDARSEPLASPGLGREERRRGGGQASNKAAGLRRRRHCDGNHARLMRAPHSEPVSEEEARSERRAGNQAAARKMKRGGGTERLTERADQFPCTSLSHHTASTRKGTL